MEDETYPYIRVQVNLTHEQAAWLRGQAKANWRSVPMELKFRALQEWMAQQPLPEREC